ncbi:hypothetical protein ACFL6U_27860 [Planctomycetota bacterium]
MKKLITLGILAMVTVSASAAVRIIVEDVNGKAAIKYETDGELVRAFALDISVDTGVLTAISGFHRGESFQATPGYGIFPSAFAAVIDVNEITGEVDTWDVNDYTPLADPCDAPLDTRPGLGSPGVTIEMGALYSPPGDDSPNAPGTSGTLCLMSISETTTVKVTTNKIRGRIVLTDPTVEADIDLSKAEAVVTAK